jgi:serine/threonine-protein kinase
MIKHRILAFTALSIAALAAQPALADDHFAAIAFSASSGALGWSNDFPSRDRAEEEAMIQCGPGCTPVIWFKDACGAIATAADHAYGTGWAASRGEAEEIAMKGCHEHAESCSVQRWICTTR